MSDKKKQLGDALRTRTVATSKPPLDIATVEMIGREPAPAPTPEPTPPKPPVQRTSFNFPADVYEAMLEHTFRQRITMRDYLVDLIKKDLGI
jgi:hypothetical protein